ncbi:gag-pol polyprotein [Tanacetum coccineum]
MVSFREYRNGDIPFRNHLCPEKIGNDVKIIDVLALIEDEEKFSKIWIIESSCESDRWWTKVPELIPRAVAWTRKTEFFKLESASFFTRSATVAEWFRWMTQNGLITDCPRFEESVKNRFSPSKYEDPQGALFKLLQTGTVAEYQEEFEKLMNRVTDISETLLISFYISELKLPLQRELLVSKPTTLGGAFALARVTKAQLEDQGTLVVAPKITGTSGGSQYQCSTSVVKTSLLPASPKATVSTNRKPLAIKWISPAERQERLSEALRFNCDNRWTWGHKCLVKFLLLMTDNDEGSSEEVAAGDDEVVESGDISILNSLVVTPTNRVAAKYRLPLSVILYPPGSSKVAAVDELLVERNGLLRFQPYRHIRLLRALQQAGKSVIMDHYKAEECVGKVANVSALIGGKLRYTGLHVSILKAFFSTNSEVVANFPEELQMVNRWNNRSYIWYSSGFVIWKPEEASWEMAYRIRAGLSHIVTLRTTAMATKFEIEKFNGNNFSLWKLKMKAILRKDKCLAAIGERPTEVTDDSKWDEMDGNAVANLHLALPDGLTSLSCKIDSQERAEILLQSLPDSYDQVIINLTSNVLSDYLVFDDVAAAILEEENRRNNREDMQTSSRQVEALVVTRGRSMEPGSSGSQNHGKSKTGKKKNFKCFKCGKPGHFKKDCRGLTTSYPQGNVASTSEDGNALCCEAAVANENRKRFADVWLFDTGATFHMTARREWFHQYKPIFVGGSVYSCNDHELKIIGIGSIMVKMHVVRFILFGMCNTWRA